MTDRTRIILSSGKDQSLRRFHPWVFSGAIKKIKGPVDNGDIVEVFDNKDQYLGTGHYQDGSIAVRIFSFEQSGEYGKEFWTNKIRKAYAYRESIGITNDPQTNVYRLVYAEGDGLPGLVIDYYNGVAVFQAHSVGMFKQRDDIAAALQESLGNKLIAVYDKSSESLHRPDIKNEYIFGSAPEIHEVKENGNRFYIDWETGQKTGFFIDQRENRALLAQYSKGKKVCNTFCYT
ncbi:MAG TPA: class I SAM-dependent methyltransferase, partial [Bacteroidia bacterium]|nr:class I SAM-dependent methyltransferase [Bacteroidia bacterium]